MHLLFSNFKKQANSLPLGNFSCAVVSTTICMYLYLHIPHWPNFPQTKTFITFDRYWSLACYRSIFKVHSKCIYAIILHTTQGWTTQVVIYRLNIGRKKTWRYIPPSIHFRKNPIFDTVNLLNTKILCIFNVKLSTFPSDHLALCIYDIVNLWWINYRW